MDRGDQFHFVMRIVRDQGIDDRSPNLAGDEHRETPRAAEGMVFRSEFNSLSCFEGLEGLEIFGFSDLKVERSRIGVYGEFAGTLVLDPGDLGEIRSNPHAVDDLSPDLNWMSLSFSGHSSIFGFPID